jgi:hypothetical protein
VRQIGMSSAVAAVGDPVLARWLTHETPEAILSGGVLPPRPMVRRRRWLTRRD